MLKVVLFTLLLSASLFASTLNEAKHRAAKEDKAILLMLSKQDCDACWYMQNIVFTDKKMQVLLEKNFVVVHLDIHKDNIPKSYEYLGTPTFYFLNAQEEKISRRIDGAKNIKDFTVIIDEVLKN